MACIDCPMIPLMPRYGMSSDDIYFAQRWCPASKCNKETRTQVELLLTKIRLTCSACHGVRELDRIPAVVRHPQD